MHKHFQFCFFCITLDLNNGKKLFSKWKYLFGRTVLWREPPWKIHFENNFFPLFRSKVMQKTKNWKYLCIFSPGPSPLKFYYIKHLCKMELLRQFKVFRFFHYKTILFSSESEFSMKNVIFWGTLCWCSSKIKKYGGVLISYNCSLWAPLQLF